MISVLIPEMDDKKAQECICEIIRQLNHELASIESKIQKGDDVNVGN